MRRYIFCVDRIMDFLRITRQMCIKIINRESFKDLEVGRTVYC